MTRARWLAAAVVILLIAAAGAAFPLLVFADAPLDPPPLTAQEVRLNALHLDMLRQRRYAELDRDMNQIQQEYERGSRSDVELFHLFQAFYDTDQKLERHFAEWIAAYSQSYAAREAEGMYFRRRGVEARGGKYFEDTPPEQIARMRTYLDRAVVSFRAAFSLTPRPLLTHCNMMSISRLLGDRAAAERLVRSAAHIDPRNFIVRYKYMQILETRWGGSLEEMVAFRNEIQQVGLTSEQLGYLDELIAIERRWLAKRRDR